ncbi:MAG: peptidoglycan-binding protein [Cyanobacteria bacterium P01_F01_bin.13]
MPSLTPVTQLLAQDTCFSVIDFVDLRSRGQRSRRDSRAALQDAKMLVTRYVDLLDPGMGKWLQALIQDWGETLTLPDPIENLAAVPELLNGAVTLPQDGRYHSAVVTVQRALMALAKRRNIKDYLLPRYGADGDYGGETIAAVKAFQSDYTDLEVTGSVDQKTAQTLDRVLRLTRPTGMLTATPNDIVSAAVALCEHPKALNYGVPHPWVNIDPFHAVPVNRPFSFLTNRWKCNLFGGNVLRKGGYEPPFYGNRGGGEYPNANQWQKWSDRYAAIHNNKVHFQLIAELQPDAIADSDERLRVVNQLLQVAEPGDFLMQDHPGPSVADGGHTRVAVANNFDLDRTVAFAQAQFARAEVQDEEAADLLPAENLWLLRPNLTM